jgi:GrpB-like predicted nucleotidyltransferase (UPF0157 family)
MLRPEQEKWINHLRDDDQIIIKPYDPSCQQKYEAVKHRVQATVGENLPVEHCGASALGISGQDEIDIFIPVPPDRFNDLVTPLTNLFGPPRSHYPLERARFVTEDGGKHIDIFLINETCSGWVDGRKFETYLKTHPDALEAYRKLKEEGNGLSTRQYYKRKIEFINNILEQASTSS